MYLDVLFQSLVITFQQISHRVYVVKFYLFYGWFFAARRVTDVFPMRQVKFSCFDSSLSYHRLPVDNVTVPAFLLLGRVPHNAAHVICFCLPPTIVRKLNNTSFRKAQQQQGNPRRSRLF